MVAPNHFNPWIFNHKRVLLALLMVILFTSLSQFASFALVQQHVKSFFGGESEDISFAFQMTYVGILATLPIQFRFLKRFDPRNYLLVALILGILLNLGCLFTVDLISFTLLRFFIGITTCMVAGCMLITIFSVLPEKNKNIVGVGLFFGALLSIGILVGVAAAWVVERMDWNALYYFLIIFQVLSILLCFLLFKEETFFRRVPLYQLDYISGILVVCFGTLIAYVFIYGPKYYWFEDQRIVFASLASIAFFLLFINHQAIVKRPSIDLRVFRFKKFWFGLFLLTLFFGIKDSVNLVYGYAAGILGWSPSDIISLGLYNVFGVVVSSVVSIKVILSKKQNLPKLLFMGFGLLLVFHMWIYWNLTPDLSFFNLTLPIFIQGFASGLLFAPIIILCVASLPPFTGMTGVIVCAYCRFVISLNSLAGFNTLQEIYNQEFKLGFLDELTPYNESFVERSQLYKNYLISQGFSLDQASGIAGKLVGKSIAIQSQLLTTRTIFLLTGYLIIAAICSLVVFGVVSKYQLKRQGRLPETKYTLK